MIAWILKNGNPSETGCVPDSGLAKFNSSENNAPIPNFSTDLGGKSRLVRSCRFHSCGAKHASYNVDLRTSKVQSSPSCGHCRPTYPTFSLLRVIPTVTNDNLTKCLHEYNKLHKHII